MGCEVAVSTAQTVSNLHLVTSTFMKYAFQLLVEKYKMCIHITMRSIQEPRTEYKTKNNGPFFYHSICKFELRKVEIS